MDHRMMPPPGMHPLGAFAPPPPPGAPPPAMVLDSKAALDVKSKKWSQTNTKKFSKKKKSGKLILNKIKCYSKVIIT